MRRETSVLSHRFALTLVAALAVPGRALAGWGDENWGALVWGESVSVPGPGLVGLTLLALALAAAAAWTLRKRRHGLGLTLLSVLLVIPLAVAAGTLAVPNSFMNGTVADADEVNSNFDAVSTAVNDNDTAISTNATAIATNATAIADETTARTAADATHDTAISTNATAISANATAISTNATAISANATAISTNATAIAGETTARTAADATHDIAISTNATMIAVLQGQVAVLQTAVAALQAATCVSGTTLVYNVPLSDYGNSGSECSGTGIHRYNGCGAGVHPTFTWVDTASAGCTASSVLVEYTHGVSCGSGPLPVELNGATVATWTQINACSCTPGLTPGSTSFAPGASYNIGGSNTVAFEGTSCSGFSPVSGSTYAVITVDY